MILILSILIARDGKTCGRVRAFFSLGCANLLAVYATAVKPLEYQVEYRALEQSLNITM